MPNNINQNIDCDGNVPVCKKKNCYKKIDAGDSCHYTTDVREALKAGRRKGRVKMVIEIGMVINSFAIIATAVAVAKHNIQIKKLGTEMVPKQKLQCLVKEIRDLGYEVEVAKTDLKSLRLELTGNGERQPVPEEYFKHDFYCVGFSDGSSMKESQLNYIADIAIKAITSELPEEKQTLEIITEIIEKAKRNLQKSRIISE